MATKKTATDAFKHLRPKKAEVPVGTSTFTLSTSKMHQETALLETLSELDVGSVFKPLGQILSINSDAQETSALDIIPKVAEKGPELWSAARTVLGRQLSPAMVKSAVILLDTPTNRKILLDAGIIPDTASEERDEDQIYIGCREVRAYIRDEISLVQSTYIINKAFELNEYASALGNLVPLATGE